MPALPPDLYLTNQRYKRKIKAKQFSDCISKNIVERSVINNSRCFVVKDYKTETYKNSFFIKTVVEWNQLSEINVRQQTVEGFKQALPQCI